MYTGRKHPKSVVGNIHKMCYLKLFYITKIAILDNETLTFYL